MPYHLLHETQIVKDGLFADHTQTTCMVSLLYLNQQHTTLTIPLLDTTPLPAKSSQLPLYQLEPAQDTPISTLPPPLLQEQLDLLSSKLLTRPGPTDLRSHAPSIPQPISTSQDLTYHHQSTAFYGYNPYLILPVMLLSLATLITIEIRILNANKPFFDRFDNWLRRAHKGTSRFRQKNTQASSLEKGGIAVCGNNDGGAGKRKSKRKKSQLRGPGIVIKQFTLSVNGWVKRMIRNASQGRDEMLIRSFDGKPLSPTVSRAWRPRFDDAAISATSFSGSEPHYNSINSIATMSITALPINEIPTSRVAYGVPSAVRARRTTVASTIPLAGEGIDAPPMSILRQQVIDEEEACSASDGKVDMAVLGQPRGEDEREVEDLEAQEVGRVLRGIGGGDGMVVDRRR